MNRALSLKQTLENFYLQYNHREFVHPDPLEFLYKYGRLEDREIVGLIASCLAYGNVKQILVSVGKILNLMGESPRSFVEQMGKGDANLFDGFIHRWHRGQDMAALLTGLASVVKEYGSLGNCFKSFVQADDPHILGALESWVKEITKRSPPFRLNLLPDPARGSASKRLFMFLRWMVRKDAVDPGGWDFISPSKLLIPLDTHMHQMALKLRLTKRKQADLKTVLEITKAFGKITPDDPVRYDFALTRPGIRKDFSKVSLLSDGHRSKELL